MSKSASIFGQLATSVNTRLSALASHGKVTMAQLSAGVTSDVAGIDAKAVPHLVRFHINTLSGVTVKKGKNGGISVDHTKFVAA